MKYASGEEVELGDRVGLGADENGEVVFIVDSNQYSESFPENEWAGYLTRGVMMRFPKFGLVHYEVQVETDVRLIRRTNAQTQMGSVG